MNTSSNSATKPLDLVLRLAFIALILMWCVKIVSPFVFPVLWGIIIAVAMYPLFLKLKKSVGGRDKLAGAIFIVVSLALFIAPAAWLTDSIIEGASTIGTGLQEGTLKVPPPSGSVKDWPAIGEKVFTAWSQAAANLETFLSGHSSQMKEFGGMLVGGVASLSRGVVHTIIALIIASVLMSNAVGGSRIGYAFADRLGGPKGRELVDLSIATIRSVVKGVLLVALIQSLAAAAGLVFAGVPAPGFCAFLVMIVAIVQLPPILILGPIAAYVFSANDSAVVAVVFLVWSLVVSFSDGLLKPLFLGRGVAVPMFVILVGAIGGMMTEGVIGLFLGAVILSIGYKLTEAWLGESVERKPLAAGPG